VDSLFLGIVIYTGFLFLIRLGILPLFWSSGGRVSGVLILVRAWYVGHLFRAYLGWSAGVRCVIPFSLGLGGRLIFPTVSCTGISDSSAILVSMSLSVMSFASVCALLLLVSPAALRDLACIDLTPYLFACSPTTWIRHCLSRDCPLFRFSIVPIADSWASSCAGCERSRGTLRGSCDGCPVERWGVFAPAERGPIYTPFRLIASCGYTIGAGDSVVFVRYPRHICADMMLAAILPVALWSTGLYSVLV